MQTTKMFIYHQAQRVILLDYSGDYFSRRYRIVYAKDLIAHRGTDNRILIEMVNQDQKRVDITGKEFTCRLISANGERLLLEKPLEIVNATAGQTKLTLTEQELDKIKPGKISYSIEQVANGLPYEPVYVDDNAGARGVIHVVDSIMPRFVESNILTIPDHVGLAYQSSIINTEDQNLHTFQIEMDNYSGDVIIEGAADTDSQWYIIDTRNYTNSTLDLFNIVGYHPYIRFNITDAAGSILKITYR